jgi:hypothetical protein
MNGDGVSLQSMYTQQVAGNGPVLCMRLLQFKREQRHRDPKAINNNRYAAVRDPASCISGLHNNVSPNLLSNAVSLQ